MLLFVSAATSMQTDSLYPEQKRFVQEALSAWKSNEIAVFESPTGTGKTRSALTAALASSASQIFYLSKTHQQLEQAVHELRSSFPDTSFSVLSSRSRMCIHPTLPKDDPATLKRLCRRERARNACTFYNQSRDIENLTLTESVAFGTEHTVCPFYAARRAAQRTRVVFAPYSLISPDTFVLAEACVIIDEAHNLPHFLLTENTHTISADDLAMGFAPGTTQRTVVQALRRMASGPSRKETVDAFLQRARLASIDTSSLVFAHSDCLTEFARALTTSAHGSIVCTENGTLSLFPASPEDSFRRVLLAKCVLLMGGTLSPDTLLLRIIAPTGRSVRRKTFSHVCTDRLVLSIGSVPGCNRFCFTENARDAGAERSALAAVCALLRVASAGCLVFLPSRRLLPAFAAGLSSRGIDKVFVEDIDAYRNAVAGNNDAVLLSSASGKLGEGVDFKNDLSRLVIVVGIPLPYTDFFASFASRIYGSDFQTACALNAAFQCAGRAFRWSGDWGCVVFLDIRFDTYLPQAPQWLQESARKLAFGEAVLAIRNYFNAHRAC